MIMKFKSVFLFLILASTTLLCTCQVDYHGHHPSPTNPDSNVWGSLKFLLDIPIEDFDTATSKYTPSGSSQSSSPNFQRDHGNTRKQEDLMGSRESKRVRDRELYADHKENKTKTYLKSLERGRKYYSEKLASLTPEELTVFREERRKRSRRNYQERKKKGTLKPKNHLIKKVNKRIREGKGTEEDKKIREEYNRKQREKRKRAKLRKQKQSLIPNSHSKST